MKQAKLFEEQAKLFEEQAKSFEEHLLRQYKTKKIT
jgi:hypothetical protein